MNSEQLDLLAPARSLPQLRDYQLELTDDVTRAFDDGLKRVMLYCPTGGGKTEMGMHLVDQELRAGGRPLWLANRIDLIEQTSGRFDRAGISHGILQGRHFRTDRMQSAQIGSIQTVVRRDVLKPTLIVIDEAHGAASVTYRNFIAAHRDVPLVGLSATPFTKGLGANVQKIGGPLFERLCWRVIPRDLIQRGWLVDCRIFAPSKPDLSAVRIVAGDYDEAQLAAVVDRPKLIADIVETWMKLAREKRTIVFATNIDHSKHIVSEFIGAGVKAEHIDAYTEPADREAILNRLRSGETQVISNVALLAEGFDLPALECMVLARPTKSKTRWLQMIGRILRPAPGKEYGLVLDHSGSVEDQGFPTDDMELFLDDGKKPDKKKSADEEPKAKVCPRCAHVRSPQLSKCPACGYEPEYVPGKVTVGEGELELKGKHSRLPAERRQEIYSALLHQAQLKGYKPGWAAVQYKEMCGTWPNGLSQRDVTDQPVDEVEKWMVYLRIKNAKSKQAKDRNRCACGSTNVKYSRISGQTRLSCGGCGKQWWRMQGAGGTATTTSALTQP